MENFVVLSYFYGSTIIINHPINVDVSPEFSILDYVYFDLKCFLNVLSIFIGIWNNNCRGKGLRSYIGSWALSKDINRSEDKQINDERPPDQIL